MKQRVLLEYPESLARAMMVRTSGWKLIYRLDGDRELYDLAADPHELKNLYADPACAWSVAI